MAWGGCFCRRTGKTLFAISLQLLFLIWMGSHVSSLDRFAVALEPFLDSLQMVQKHIMPGKLTWPFTKEVVKETQPNYLKVCGSKCLLKMAFIKYHTTGGLLPSFLDF